MVKLAPTRLALLKIIFSVRTLFVLIIKNFGIRYFQSIRNEIYNRHSVTTNVNKYILRNTREYFEMFTTTIVDFKSSI